MDKSSFRPVVEYGARWLGDPYRKYHKEELEKLQKGSRKKMTRYGREE